MLWFFLNNEILHVFFLNLALFQSKIKIFRLDMCSEYCNFLFPSKRHFVLWLLFIKTVARQ